MAGGWWLSCSAGCARTPPPYYVKDQFLIFTLLDRRELPLHNNATTVVTATTSNKTYHFYNVFAITIEPSPLCGESPFHLKKPALKVSDSVLKPMSYVELRSRAQQPCVKKLHDKQFKAQHFKQ